MGTTKFNFTRGSATPKGKLHTTRLISKDHAIYPLIFDEKGNKREKDVIDKNIKKVFDDAIDEAKRKRESKLLNTEEGVNNDQH